MKMLKTGFINTGLLCTALAGGVQTAVSAPVTHGVSAGDVTSDSAVIWSRTDTEAVMRVQVLGAGGRGVGHTVRVKPEHDFTGKVLVDGLKADTAYRYRVWFESKGKKDREEREVYEGRFHTAPEADDARAVSFAWSGDLAGQNVCRDREQGFPIFEAINEMKPEFFVGLGDMIYADGVCESVGRYGNAQIPGDFQKSATMRDYWGHWKYNREDAGFSELLAGMPYYAVWDDHEVVNDFGPLHDTRDAAPYTPGEHLLPLGLAAFLDYNALAPSAETPKRLYRNIRWGRHLELFLLDTRQYRDANFAADSAQAPKTLLGREQRVWLQEKLAASSATWKVIVSSVPISIPTGYPPTNGRDGWADYDQDTGFEHELTGVLSDAHARGVDNMLFITTDVHFAEVMRYTPFSDDPTFTLHEFVAGPLNAGLFPNRSYDKTLGSERLFFFGPQSGDAVKRYEDALKWMNFGTLSIDEQGVLTANIRNISGESEYALTLPPR